eukprot:CAMPEP_0170488700 /NCGR_PEP_ID=MMETSP0208-20121228/7178_1 /TAXON_ID=197538 /ORGANISM="Strombidium inclinatum, Strain S3" /LENGTH=40 /DNA_ID= /DNA_START= /DNA_END= /DNA_ORIENTATION=
MEQQQQLPHQIEEEEFDEEGTRNGDEEGYGVINDQETDAG